MDALQYNALHKFSVIRHDSWYVIGCKFRYLHGILIEKYHNIYKSIGWDKKGTKIRQTKRARILAFEHDFTPQATT